MPLSPTLGAVKSGWGPRIAPLPGGSTFHRGVDIAAPSGTPVVAPAAGTVTVSTFGVVRGHYVVVDHGQYRTLHQHMATRAVRVGQHVAEGALLGTVGSSGMSTGPHLHTEVHNGLTPIDPAPWYASRGVTLGTPPAPVNPQEDDVLNDADKTWIHDEMLRVIRAEVGPLVLAAGGAREATAVAIKSAMTSPAGVDVNALAEAVASKLAQRLAQ